MTGTIEDTISTTIQSLRTRLSKAAEERVGTHRWDAAVANVRVRQDWGDNVAEMAHLLASTPNLSSITMPLEFRIERVIDADLGNAKTGYKFARDLVRRVAHDVALDVAIRETYGD